MYVPACEHTWLVYGEQLKHLTLYMTMCPLLISDDSGDAPVKHDVMWEEIPNLRKCFQFCHFIFDA